MGSRRAGVSPLVEATGVSLAGRSRSSHPSRPTFQTFVSATSLSFLSSSSPCQSPPSPSFLCSSRTGSCCLVASFGLRQRRLDASFSPRSHLGCLTLAAFLFLLCMQSTGRSAALDFNSNVETATASDLQRTASADDFEPERQFQKFNFGQNPAAFEPRGFLGSRRGASRPRSIHVASAVASLAIRKGDKPKVLLRENTVEVLLEETRDGTIACTDGPTYARGAVSSVNRVEAKYSHGHVAQVHPSPPLRMRRDGRQVKPDTVMLPVAGPSGGESLYPGSAVVIVCLGAGKAAVAIPERDVGHVSAREVDTIEFERLGSVDRSRTAASSFDSASVQKKRVPSFSRFLGVSAQVLSVLNVAFCFLALTARQVAFYEARKIDEAPGLFLDYPSLLGFSGRLDVHTRARSPAEVIVALALDHNVNTLNAYGRSHPETLRRFHRLKQARRSARASCDTLCLGRSL
ncbi:UNVERIFIED_CONTAM: hypothetical protein HHA_297647 [Hammondia hammondi]|eukprot:XP_008886096.1 hypothetical protein HHA_297647 [Hammondia hammondi]